MKTSLKVEEFHHLLSNEPKSHQGNWCPFTGCVTVDMNTCLHRMFVWRSESENDFRVCVALIGESEKVSGNSNEAEDNSKLLFLVFV